MDRQKIIKELLEYPEYSRPTKFKQIKTEDLKDCLDCIKIIFKKEVC